LHEFPLEIVKVNSVLSIDLGQELTNIIQQNGFEINHGKVRAFAYFQRQEVTGLTVNKFPNVRRKFAMQIRSMLHAWDNKGLQAAEAEHYEFYNKKHRHPDNNPPSLKKVIKGKLDFLGMVKGKDNRIYLKYKKQCNAPQKLDSSAKQDKLLCQTKRSAKWQEPEGHSRPSSRRKWY